MSGLGGLGWPNPKDEPCPSDAPTCSRARRWSDTLWTYDEVKILRKWAGKKSCKEIAIMTGRTLEAVRQKAKFMRIPTRLQGEQAPRSKYSDAQVELLRKLKEEGLTHRQISIATGVPMGTVCQIVNFWSRCNGRVIF